LISVRFSSVRGTNTGLPLTKVLRPFAIESSAPSHIEEAFAVAMVSAVWSISVVVFM